MRAGSARPGALRLPVGDIREELARRRRQWRPLPGPQSIAYHSPADELFYGGAAGGGKTDLLLGVARLEHRRAIIFRRVSPSLGAIVERSKAMYADPGAAGPTDAFNVTRRCWSFADGRTVRFASIQFEEDKSDYQGQAHDFYGFDEITEFTEGMFRFVTCWNRTALPGQRCRVVCTGNPPCTAEGEWVIGYWAPWLDPTHPSPAEPGELRWFTTVDGKDMELPGPGPMVVNGETVTPRSRTFIPAKVQDNPHLVEAGYVARLQALPEPLRSKMLYGDFTKGREDDPWQVIPSEWVRRAQERWRGTPRPGVPMTAMGVDVARGGGDKTVLAMRYGQWIDELRAYPGASTPDGPAVAALVLANRRDRAAINVDAIGVGASVYDHLRGVTENVAPINGAERSDATDRSGELRFVNLRAELWWKAREALDPANDGPSSSGADVPPSSGADVPPSSGADGPSSSGEGLCLPPDRELLADLCAPRWKLTVRGVQVEAKEELAKRIGRSPDKGDAVVYALGSKAGPGMGLFNWVKSEAKRAAGGGL